MACSFNTYEQNYLEGGGFIFSEQELKNSVTRGGIVTNANSVVKNSLQDIIRIAYVKPGELPRDHIKNDKLLLFKEVASREEFKKYVSNRDKDSGLFRVNGRCIAYKIKNILGRNFLMIEKATFFAPLFGIKDHSILGVNFPQEIGSRVACSVNPSEYSFNQRYCSLCLDKTCPQLYEHVACPSMFPPKIIVSVTPISVFIFEVDVERGTVLNPHKTLLIKNNDGSIEDFAEILKMLSDSKEETNAPQEQEDIYNSDSCLDGQETLEERSEEVGGARRKVQNKNKKRNKKHSKKSRAHKKQQENLSEEEDVASVSGEREQIDKDVFHAQGKSENDDESLARGLEEISIDNIDKKLPPQSQTKTSVHVCKNLTQQSFDEIVFSTFNIKAGAKSWSEDEKLTKVFGSTDHHGAFNIRSHRKKDMKPHHVRKERNEKRKRNKKDKDET